MAKNEFALPNEEQALSYRSIMMFFAFLVSLSVFGTLLCGLWYGHLSIQSVLHSGIPTDAILEDKYIDEHNHYWLRYRFNTRNDETYLSVIEVSEAQYHQYPIGSALPMRYADDNPNFNALEIMQSNIKATYWILLQLSAALALLFSILGIILWRILPIAYIRTLWNPES